MWTWEKIKNCEEIKRGVLVDSSSESGYGFDQAVILDKFDDSLKIVEGNGVKHTGTSIGIYSGFKFYHTTGAEILPPKERETITLYETLDIHGNVRMCDKSGGVPNYELKEMMSIIGPTRIRKANINKNKYVVIYADTFEVKEWSN